MPVLLLAQGDHDARTLLREAIEARYSMQPPSIECVCVDFTAEDRAKLGPITLKVPLEVKTCFQFPQTMRWDFTGRRFGMTLRQGIDAFDGTTYRRMRGSDQTSFSNEEIVQAAQQQLWTMAAVLLTPLNEHFVKVTTTGGLRIQALNTQTNDTATLQLRDNKTVEWVSARIRGIQSQQTHDVTIRLSEKLSNVSGLLLPDTISVTTNNGLAYDLKPVSARVNQRLDESVFRLEQELPG